MSDHDAATDPVDKAYVEAEALLSDDAARAERRARVLAAVAREPAKPFSAAAASGRRSPWRRGGWLAAASVAVFCSFLAARVYQPVRNQSLTAAPAALPASEIARTAAPSAASAKSPAVPRRPAFRPQARALASATPSSRDIHPVEPAARKAQAEPAPEAFRAPPPPPPLAVPAAAPATSTRMTLQSSGLGEVVVTGSRIARPNFTALTPRPPPRSISAAVAD